MINLFLLGAGSSILAGAAVYWAMKKNAILAGMCTAISVFTALTYIMNAVHMNAIH